MLSIQLFFLYINLFSSVTSRPTEAERVQLWYEEGNVWPPQWQPETDAFKDKMALRFICSRLLPRFTEKGFDLIKIPPAVYLKLKNAVDIKLKDWDNQPYENEVADTIYGPVAPKMIDLGGELDHEVLKELQYLHEEWSNLELIPISTYGVRMYQNGSSMVMHYDKTEFHVISSIVHIAHQYDDDNEPWPIEIEDQNGDLHAVLLEEGEMLFYESAISLHGRRSALKGKYYGSLFLHYKPADKSIWNYTTEDIIAHISPHWGKGILEDHGSRWAGQAITTDSMIAAGAPERYVGVNQNMGVPLTLLSGDIKLSRRLNPSNVEDYVGYDRCGRRYDHISAPLATSKLTTSKSLFLAALNISDHRRFILMLRFVEQVLFAYGQH
eukprot:gene15377-20731_t